MILRVLELVGIEEKTIGDWVGVKTKGIWITMEIEKIRTFVEGVGNALKRRDWELWRGGKWIRVSYLCKGFQEWGIDVKSFII